MLCFDLQNKNKFGLESCHLVTPNIFLHMVTKTCVFYFALPLVIYLSFHSPLLCVLQNPLNKKGPFSWIQHFCLHFTRKDMMTYKGKSLGQNHSAWQKKRMQSNSLNLLPPPSNHTTISSLTGLFCFNKVNSSANIKPEREKIRWCLHDIRQEMHHYFDKCCFCPTAQCSKIEMGLEKSWHEQPCPGCPLIPNLLSLLNLKARTCLLSQPTQKQDTSWFQAWKQEENPAQGLSWYHWVM